MKNTLLKTMLGLSVCLATSPAFAAEHVTAQQHLSNQVADIVGSSNEVYEDKIDVSYLAKLVITPKDDWIGKKVYRNGDVCIEVTKELKFKTVKEPFKHLYRSANLPKAIDIGVMEENAKVVDCSEYVSHSKVIS